MTSPPALVLSGVLVVGAALSAVRLTARTDGGSYLGGRSSDTAHLLMNAGMAAMLVVPATVLPPSVPLVLYAAIAAAFAGLVVLGLARPGPSRILHRPAHVYHAIAASAMVWAVHLMAPGPPLRPGPGHEMAGMPAVSGMPAPTHHAPVAYVLAGLFVLDAVGTLALLRRLPDRTAVVPHVIMDVGMVLMLVPAWLPLPA